MFVIEFFYKILNNILKFIVDFFIFIYLRIEDKTNNRVFLIELKGTDLSKAIEQIDATVVMFKVLIKNYEISPRIVYKSNTHKVHNSAVRNFKKLKNAKVSTNVIENAIKFANRKFYS